MPALVLALLLAADPPTGVRLFHSEVSGSVGLLGTSFTYVGGRTGDLLVLPSVQARGVFGGFTLEGGASVARPVQGNGAATAVTGALRAGWTGERFSALAGATVQWANGATPALAIMPTLRVDRGLGPVIVSLGILDSLGLVPAHLSVTWKRFNLGWVAPIGLIAGGEIPLPGGLDLRVTGFAFKLSNVEMAMLTVSCALRGAP